LLITYLLLVIVVMEVIINFRCRPRRRGLTL